MSSKAAYEHLIPSCWRWFGKLGTLQWVQPGWREVHHGGQAVRFYRQVPFCSSPCFLVADRSWQVSLMLLSTQLPLCGGLNDNGPYRPMCSTTLVSSGWNCLGRIRRRGLAGRGVSTRVGGVALRFQWTCSIPTVFSARLVVWDRCKLSAALAPLLHSAITDSSPPQP